MMGRRGKIGLIVAAALPLLLATYEVAAVLRARSATPEILSKVRSGEIEFGSVPAARIDMLLAVEDPGFYGHRGIDFSTPGQGMTTLTQSLAKFLYFDRFSPGFAKLELMLVARFALDPAATKQEQLEIFLNHARFGRFRGRQVRGFADAARTFYGREFASLDDRQFLSLVAMLIGPNQLDPVRHSEANADRTARIVALLGGRCRPSGLRDVYYDQCSPRLADQR
jgi:membrane peptidoglycan carboxypeptidase